jgi:hypothetical protein
MNEAVKGIEKRYCKGYTHFPLEMGMRSAGGGVFSPEDSGSK